MALLKILLSLSIEFGPILSFLIASELTTFINATIIFVATTTIALIAGFVERKQIAWFPLIVAVSVISFGLLTILLQNPFYIIIKDTLYNGIFSIVLFAGLAFDKPFLKFLFNGLFAMTHKGWSILTFRWAVMFALLAVSNEVARINLDPEHWIIYKGISTLVTICFTLYQFKLSKKERLPEASSWGMRTRPQKKELPAR